MYVLEETKYKINQSLFSTIDPNQNGHPEKLFSRYYGTSNISTRATSLGTLLHSAILENEEFSYYDKPIPPSTKSVYDAYIEVNKSKALDKELLLKVAKTIMNNKWKDETILSKLNDHSDYLTQLQSGKKLISLEDAETIASVKKLCQQNHIKPYLEECEHENEKKFQYTTAWGEYFGTIDRLFHMDNTFRVLDLKTTSAPFGSFEFEIRKRKYCRQVGFYSHCYSKITNKEPLNPRIVMVQTTNDGHKFLLGQVFEFKMEDYYKIFHPEVELLTKTILNILKTKNFEQQFLLKTLNYD